MSEKKAHATDKVSSLELEEKDFLELLATCIGFTEHLQNSPPSLLPQEDLVADTVVRYLEPFTAPHGPLLVKKITYKKDRSNVIVTYPGLSNQMVSFVGSHMDVVPANPKEWKRNPFQLIQEGDKLFGRGVTDCLGHVCMITNLFKQLAVHKPKLNRSVVAVFIANEEASVEKGIGIDELEKRGELAHLKYGPLYWVDSANFGPTLGTGGALGWELTVTGKKFHSGLPHKGINAIELAMEVIKHVQDRFYADFQRFSAEEKRYLFDVSSSIKPTQIATAAGSINQIPGVCTVSGDIRFTPFYSVDEVKGKLEQYIAEMDVAILPSRGASKYHLPAENLRGQVELKWLGHPYQGVAVNLESNGYQALHSAIATVCGEAKPFSLTGSLPIIRDLQDSGFDVQVTGFGRMEVYHACDEFGLLSDFIKGFRVFTQVIEQLDSH